VLGSAESVRSTRRGLTVCGRRVGALYRYLPFEWMLGRSSFAELYDAVAARHVRLLNGLYGLLLQNKALMTRLWAQRDDAAFDEAERQAIAEHLAPCWPLGGEPHEIDRAELVAKQVFGREGEEVFFGEDLSSARWSELQRQRTYIAQRRIRAQAIEAAMPTALGCQPARGFVTVGVYVIDGRCAGFYSRFGGKIIDARAKWLATFVTPDEAVKSGNESG
jgi:glutathionylspermidine synthase